MANMKDGWIYNRINFFLSSEPTKSHSLKSICNFVGCDKRSVNQCLYAMLKNGMVFKTQESCPPKWQIAYKEHQLNAFSYRSSSDMS